MEAFFSLRSCILLNTLIPDLVYGVEKRKEAKTRDRGKWTGTLEQK